MNPFKVGDVVIPKKYLVLTWPKAFTMNKYYTVVSVAERFVRVVKDDGIKGGFEWRDFTLSVKPLGTAPTHYPDYTTSVLSDSDLDMTYEERKAAAPVCSAGKFKQGSKLRYCDGTSIPNGEDRTVTRCTATCVWFEETYSMPFNPNEFEVN